MPAVHSIRDIAVIVRGRRLELALSQSRLATEAGVSRKWVSEFEAGKPTAELGLVLRVLDALHLSLELVPQAERSSEPGSETTDLDALLEKLRGPARSPE